MHRTLILITFLLLTPLIGFAQTTETSGSLLVRDPAGKQTLSCPLKHTDVRVEISGFMSRVVVTQEFENPFKERIEAVYVFPLPQKAAVDDMTMLVGDRIVRGKILPREEAQNIYEAAKAGGQVASLLDQERPNIFTQSVANILPGEKIKIKISYVETLKYEDGAYEFVFPMVVGPRYVPGTPAVETTGGTNQVPDAARIKTPTMPAETRSGHDISLEVTVDAGLLIESVVSKTHDVELLRPDVRSARIKLKDSDVIPNRDFILRFDVAGKTIQDALLTHRSDKGGYFTLMIQPPAQIKVADVTPKELVFVLDTSGSMGGFPIEKAKETMKLALDGLYPNDKFNLITFAGDTSILFPEPVAATAENLKKAQEFLSSRAGHGGTEMMTAIRAALKPSTSSRHMRVVCFMTDGYVGNDMEIIAEIKKQEGVRVFSFGIGEAVNRFLLDKMAEAGRGEVEYVSLKDDGSAAARRFHERIRNPLLTDISIDWSGLPVADVYPRRIPDLFGARPVVVTGRFTGAGRGTVRLKGRMAGSDFVRDIPVELPETMATHDVLMQLWARERIDDLMGQDYAGIQNGTTKVELKNTITQLGLEYRLMTQFTSFVAVEEMIVTESGQPRRVDVPIELPSGTSGVNTQDASPGQMFVATRGSQQISFNGGVSGREGNFLLIAAPTNPGPVAASTTPKPTSRKGKISAAKGSGQGDGSGVGPGIGSGTGGGIGPGSSGNVGGGALMGVSGAAGSPPPIGVDAGDVLRVTSPVSAEDKQKAEQRMKLHPLVLKLVESSKKQPTTPFTEDESRFIKDGKADLQIWLIDKSDENIAKLKELGFEVVLDPKSSKLVIGRVAIDKVQTLAELSFVRYIAPQLR
jgi:Ca-activated chloride channel homolog